jgi:putative addiction module component (TIGR02574 family)
MAHTVKDFDYSQLSSAERILLAQELWDSVEPEARSWPLTAEQQAEIERRIAAIDAGTMPTYPWEDVKQRLLNRK